MHRSLRIESSIGQSFQPFSPAHGVTVVVCAAFIASLLVVAGRNRQKKQEQTLRRSFAWFALAWQVFATIWWLLPAPFDLAISLPLQLCDLVGVIGPIALLTQNRRLRSLLYFWGLGFSTEAFITPILADGPATVHFWLFWGGHTLIVAGALYDLIIRRYRPTTRDYLFVTLVGVAYVAVIATFDLVFKLNYGYLGDSLPDARTALDVLGPYPWRIGSIFLVGQTILTLLWIVWLWPRRRVSSAD